MLYILSERPLRTSTPILASRRLPVNPDGPPFFFQSIQQWEQQVLLSFICDKVHQIPHPGIYFHTFECIPKFIPQHIPDILEPHPIEHSFNGAPTVLSLGAVAPAPAFLTIIEASKHY